MLIPSVVVHDFDVLRTSRRPAKADTPLIVDANTVLAGSIALQCFKPVSRWNPQIIQAPGNLKLPELALSHRSEIHETANTIAPGQCFGVSALERLDHVA